MDTFLFQNKGITRIDIAVILDKKLAFLSDFVALQDIKAQIGLFKWGDLEGKKVLFFFRFDHKAIEAAKKLGARSVMTVQTVRSLNPELASGDVLLLDSQDGTYDTSLLENLAPSFGVKKGYCVLSPQEGRGLRLLGFRVAVNDIKAVQTDCALMNDIIQHLLICPTANL